MRHIFRYDPQIGKVVEISEFDIRPRQTTLNSGVGPQIMPDIKPYRAVGIDGRMVTSRSEHRALLKEHNCIEVGNEKPAFMKEREG